MSDDTPTDAAQTQRSGRKKLDSGFYIPVAAVGALVLSFGIFLFNRIETKYEALDAKMEARCDAIEAKMEAARSARNAQVASVERDVVRLQDQGANFAALLAEIKGDVHTIIDKLDEINRRKP